MGLKHVALCVTIFFILGSLEIAVGQHRQQMMRSRVPADKLEKARALTSPLAQSKEILAKGKVIYEGKGTCVNCHGATGHGDGPGATNLNPPPRVFRSHGFWRHRTEGEIFWVIKHGSPGTAMIPFGGLLTDEEIWTVMQYERSFAGGHGRRRGKGGHKGGGPRGMHGGRKGMGMMKNMRHHRDGEDNGCCQKSE